MSGAIQCSPNFGRRDVPLKLNKHEPPYVGKRFMQGHMFYALNAKSLLKVIKKFGGEVKEWKIDEEVNAESFLLIAGSLPDTLS